MQKDDNWCKLDQEVKKLRCIELVASTICTLLLRRAKSFNKVITTKCINRNNKSTELVLFIDPCTSEEQSTNCTRNQFNASYKLLPCFNPPIITTKKLRDKLKNEYFKKKADAIDLTSEARDVEEEFRLAKNHTSFNKSKKLLIASEKLISHFEQHFFS